MDCAEAGRRQGPEVTAEHTLSEKTRERLGTLRSPLRYAVSMSSFPAAWVSSVSTASLPTCQAESGLHLGVGNAQREKPTCGGRARSREWFCRQQLLRLGPRTQISPSASAAPPSGVGCPWFPPPCRTLALGNPP